MINRTTFFVGLALAASPVAASAQNAADIYSYKAPSGMFSEGTTKWQNFRFQLEDQERTAKALRDLESGDDVSTGSVAGSDSSSNMTSYARPGERTRSYRRQTSR